MPDLARAGPYCPICGYVYSRLPAYLFSSITMGNQHLAYKAKQVMCHHWKSWSKEGSSYVTPHAPGWDKSNTLSGSKVKDSGPSLSLNSCDPIGGVPQRTTSWFLTLTRCHHGLPWHQDLAPAMLEHLALNLGLHSHPGLPGGGIYEVLLHTVICLLLILYKRCCCPDHFIDGESETQRVWDFSQSHTAS
jgi:hypothetical protein